MRADLLVLELLPVGHPPFVREDGAGSRTHQRGRLLPPPPAASIHGIQLAETGDLIGQVWSGMAEEDLWASSSDDGAPAASRYVLVLVLRRGIALDE